MNRNSGSLCLLSVLCGGLPELAWPRRGSQRRARLPDSPPGPVDQHHHRAPWSPAGPAVAEGTGVALGCLCPRDYPRTPPGSRARAAGVASELRWGRALGFCPCAPYLAFLVHGPPPRAPTGPLLSSLSSSGCRISVAWLSVCLSVCLQVLHTLSARPAPRAEKQSRLSGKIAGGTSKAVLHPHPSEQCCPLGLGTSACLGSMVCSGPGSPHLRRKRALPAL